METTSQRVVQSADEQETLGIVATEDLSQVTVIADLDRRVRELEMAIREVRTVKASAVVGRKTASAMVARDAADVDDALNGLSVEQRLAVKSGLIRAGLL